MGQGFICFSQRILISLPKYLSYKTSVMFPGRQVHSLRTLNRVISWKMPGLGSTIYSNISFHRGPQVIKGLDCQAIVIELGLEPRPGCL